MNETEPRWTMHDRVAAVLSQRKPDRPPFIDRMELWYQTKLQAGTLPEKFKGMCLNDIHRAVGIGRQKFSPPYAFKLRGVEVVFTFQDQIIFQESEPLMDYFPAAWAPEQVPRDQAGQTLIEFMTPVGKVSLGYVFAESLISMGGMEPLLKDHLIKEENDYRTAEYIIERAEFVPRFENIYADSEMLAENGFVVPSLHRIPFQQALLEYLGEIPLFTALYESPQRLKRLIEVLDQHLVEILHRLSDLSALYVEFPDNLDGFMTNPNLFQEYCLPYYQKYADILHGQGKKVGAHTDGNLKPLLKLLAESGLDVCESFSPAPLTECTFEEAWGTWQKGPLIWGGIPSPLLEKRTSENEFIAYVERLLHVIGNRPIILGVGDMVMGNNLIERVEYIAQKIAASATDVTNP